jgi:anti-sigma regulatory factor (Ser/Thr protein kinase)
VDDRARILAQVAKRGRVTTSEIATRLGISRQAAHKKLKSLAVTGAIVAVGAGRTAAWAASASAPRRFTFSATALDENRVRERVEAGVPALRELGPDERSAFGYAFTEMVNNAVDHAEAETIEVLIEPREDGLAFEIADDGVGAFARLRTGLKLASDLESVQEVSKGKVTTDPRRHTGEGIFFTSKLADRFELAANRLCWIVDNRREDVTLVADARDVGTRVRVELGKPLRRKLDDVFAEFTTDLEFDRTRTVVKLFAIGVEFVSRSEARRLLHGLERFREVVLDFAGVTAVGQGFVDEVFRVWASDHPGTTLRAERMNPQVEFMVRRGGFRG